MRTLVVVSVCLSLLACCQGAGAGANTLEVRSFSALVPDFSKTSAGRQDSGVCVASIWTSLRTWQSARCCLTQREMQD